MVTRSSMPDFDEYVNEIKDLWETRWLTNSGVKHQKLEAELCKYLGVENLTLCVNGHQALECIIETLDLKGEIITTPFTFVSTTNAIVRSGIEPVFCDINDRDFTIDVSKIEALITEKTSAIMPVHVYGNLCDYEAIQKIADKYSLKVVYDAAHAFGVFSNGVSSAALGDASMFSFHATKVFHSIEGGCAVFKDGENAKKLNVHKNFGMTTPETLSFAGTNAKMNEFSAAMGLCNLRRIDESINSRKIAFDRYVERLDRVEGIRLAKPDMNVKANYAYFPIVIEKESFGATRDDVIKALEDKNICARKYFYPLTSSLQCFGGRYDANSTPVAKKISEEVLCLPLYEGLDTKTVDIICDTILSKER